MTTQQGAGQASAAWYSQSNNDGVREWLAEYIVETLRSRELESVVARLDSVIIAALPELADRDIRRDLAASTRAHARTMLAGLTSDTIDPSVPQEAHAFARTVARRGFELRLLLRTYHVGLEAVLDYMAEAVAARKPPHDIERAVLLRLFDRSTKWIGNSVETLTDTYMEERERVLRAALNRRTETVRAVLAGDDVDTEQASARLGYRLTRAHLAVVLWSDEPATDSAPDGQTIGLLDRSAARLATEFGSGAVLTVASGASGMWAWIELVGGGHVPPEASRAAALIEAPVRIAFGMPAERVDGFRRSHHEAMAARQVAERARGQARVTVYNDVEIAYLIGSDERAMRGLVDRELGRLAAPGPANARLRETLHAYLRCQRSPEGAARLLGVHKNTVRYRIQRIEDLLGHQVQQRALHLEVALKCVATYGSDALPRGSADVAAKQP